MKGQWSGWGGWTAKEIDWLINLLWTPSTSSTVESYCTFVEWCFWPATIFLLYIKATVLSVLLFKITQLSPFTKYNLTASPSDCGDQLTQKKSTLSAIFEHSYYGQWLGFPPPHIHEQSFESSALHTATVFIRVN